MEDIGKALKAIMHLNQCSSTRAFFLLTYPEEGDRNGLYQLQSKSCEKAGGGLCNKGNINNFK